MRTPIDQNNQAGSALIAVAALLMLLGVFVSLGIDSFKVKTPQDKAFETNRKMQIIARQLSSFVQLNNRLPCPSNPLTTYNSSSFGFSTVTCSTLASSNGVIPFRTLGLPDSFALDAWGNPFLYAASPFATNPAANTSIHAYCRTNEHWVFGITGSCATRYNVNIPKARFCCPDTTSPTADDIRIQRKDGSFLGRTRVNTNMAASADNNGINASALPAPTTPHQIESPAYVLISFGSNGGVNDGALTGDEAENADADLDFVDRYRDVASTANFFDDIVLYRTQYQVMAEINSGSCARPYQGVTPDIICP